MKKVSSQVSQGFLSVCHAFFVGVRMAFLEMRYHKLRSFLSILGVVLGVASLTAMLTLLGGIDVYLNQKMSRWVSSVWFVAKNEVPPGEKLSWARSPGMRFSDGIYLEKNTQQTKKFVHSLSRQGMISLSTIAQSGKIWGMDQDAIDNNFGFLSIENGRSFSSSELKIGAKSCLLSWDFADLLAKELKLNYLTEILQLNATVNGVSMKIIGIYQPKDTAFEPWQFRQAIILPIQTMKQYITGFDPIPGEIEIQVQDPKLVMEQAEQIGIALKEHHRGAEDFEFRTADWLEEVKRILNNTSLFMTLVSLISLLVGGLSIMNVMLSSVSERVREIGIRKALGAHNFQIFVQVISETTTLSLVGGAIGAFLGCLPLLFKEAIKRSTEGSIEPILMLPFLVPTILVVILVGIIFGLYPALKAMRLNPIDALQYE